jgi:hypothetical protein
MQVLPHHWRGSIGPSYGSGTVRSADGPRLVRALSRFASANGVSSSDLSTAYLRVFIIRRPCPQMSLDAML